MKKSAKHSKDSKKDIVVFTTRRSSTKKRALISGSVLVLMGGFFVVGLNIGTDRYFENARANTDANTGLPPGVLEQEELIPTDVRVSPLPSTDLINIESLVLGTTRATISWNQAQGEATPTSPFPKSGTYRITFTTTPNEESTWQPVASSPLGTGQRVEFIKGDGVDSLDRWETPGYDFETSDINIFPASAKQKDTYYFRVELLNDDNSWKAVEEKVAKVTIPYPTLTVFSTPEYKKETPWTENPENSRFDATNPHLKVEWRGSADDDYAIDSYIYASLTQDMAGKKQSLVTLIGKAETFASTGEFIAAQQPGTTRYYAIYNAEDKQLSDVVKVDTPPEVQ